MPALFRAVLAGEAFPLSRLTFVHAEASTSAKPSVAKTYTGSSGSLEDAFDPALAGVASSMAQVSPLQQQRQLEDSIDHLKGRNPVEADTATMEDSNTSSHTQARHSNVASAPAPTPAPAQACSSSTTSTTTTTRMPPRTSSTQSTSAPAVATKPHVLQAVYSNVPVYEMLVRGIGVMRRRSDSWINATQILKVAGISKSQRTKILDKDIAAPDSGIQFEKVQGGYGRYQGTWIPFHEAEAMADQYGILDLIRPLLDYQPAPPLAPLAGLPQMSPQATTSGPLEPLKPSQQQGQKAPLQPNARINGPPAAAGATGQDQNSGRKRPRPSLAEAQANGQGGQSYMSEVSTVAPSDAGSNSNKRIRVDAGPLAAAARTGAVAATGGTRPSTASRRSSVIALIPQKLRRASKHPDTTPVNQEHRNALMSLFMTPDASTAGEGGDEPSLAEPDANAIIATFPADLEADTPIDEQHHTALHWASALARLSTVQALLALGMDVNRGNQAGETALMRAVLVTNNFDSETFAPSPSAGGRGLLGLLAGSLRTLDDAGRTVLHHVALVAGIKGRSSAARHYMEAILHFLAEADAHALTVPEEKADSLIDVQDSHGDTALNIAARVGSRPMVRMLLESGADASVSNKLGLRAGDFGFQEEGLQPTSAAESAVDQLRGSSGGGSAAGTAGATDSTVAARPTPEQQLADVTSAIGALLASLSADFSSELSARSESLARTRSQLHAATAQVATQRASLAALRSRARQVDLSKWRIRNLEKALREEESFDWTGRLGADGEPAFTTTSAVAAQGILAGGQTEKPEVRAAFEYRGPESVLKQLPAVDMPANIDPDAPLPASAAAFAPTASSSSAASPNKQAGASNGNGNGSPPPSQLTLVQLRRMVLWYERAISLLQDRIADSRASEGDFEQEARRLVRVCTGVAPEEEVDELLESLITALESDGQAQDGGPDLQR